MDKKIKYKKFFSSQKNFLGGNSLFRVADDHFLYTELEAYKETYKRFFFADIKAIKIIKRRDWTFIICIAVLCMTMMMSVMIGVVDGDYETAWVVLAIVGIAPVVIAIYCFWAGSPVETVIKTSYSSNSVLLGRQRRTAKNLEKMTSYMAAAENIPLDDVELSRLDATEKVFRI